MTISEQLTSIIGRLKNNDPSLTTINLYGNYIGYAGAASLSEALKKNSSLTSINLSCTNIGAAGAASLSEALKKNSSLTSINLSGTNIGAAGAASLSEALEINRSLTSINLYGNNIGSWGAKSLSEALKKNSSLTSINLSYNNIRNEGAESLSEALKTNRSLTSINLYGKYIRDAGAISLSEAIEKSGILFYNDGKTNNYNKFQAIANKFLKQKEILTQAEMISILKYPNSIKHFFRESIDIDFNIFMRDLRLDFYQKYISSKVQDNTLNNMPAEIQTMIIKYLSNEQLLLLARNFGKAQNKELSLLAIYEAALNDTLKNMKETIIQASEDVKATDLNDKTPLQYSKLLNEALLKECQKSEVSEVNVTVIRNLIKAGADFNEKDYNNKTALGYLKEKNKSHNLDPNSKDQLNKLVYIIVKHNSTIGYIFHLLLRKIQSWVSKTKVEKDAMPPKSKDRSHFASANTRIAERLEDGVFTNKVKRAQERANKVAAAAQQK